MDERIEKAAEEIRPLLGLHGGDIQIVSFEGGILRIKMKGACDGCALAAVTLTQGIQEFFMMKIPGLHKVEAV